MLTLMANTNYVESIRGFVHVLLHPVWICPNSCEYPAADHFLTSIITVCYYTQSKNPLKMMDVFHVKITIRVSHRQKPFVKMCFPGICWLNPHDWWRVPQKYIIYIFELEKMNRVQSKKSSGPGMVIQLVKHFGAVNQPIFSEQQVQNLQNLIRLRTHSVRTP